MALIKYVFLNYKQNHARKESNDRRCMQLTAIISGYLKPMPEINLSLEKKMGFEVLLTELIMVICVRVRESFFYFPLFSF